MNVFKVDFRVVTRALSRLSDRIRYVEDLERVRLRIHTRMRFCGCGDEAERGKMNLTLVRKSFHRNTEVDEIYDEEIAKQWREKGRHNDTFTQVAEDLVRLRRLHKVRDELKKL